jgi:polygalacturonase
MKTLLGSLFCVFAFLFVLGCQGQPGPASEVSWKTADEIVARVQAPVFPDRDFRVTAFGAFADGTTDNTDAFRMAIDSCSSAGGGRVVVPPGTYIVGRIYLKSNVNLVVLKGATLQFSDDPSGYLPPVYTRWEGVEAMSYSSLIYAYGEKNIAITGEGVLDGQGESWWSWKGNKEYGWKPGMPRQHEARAKLWEMADAGVPVEQRIMGDGSYLRPNFFQPYRCTDVHVSGVTFKDSPMWFLHPVLSERVLVENVTVEGLGPNNDGCNPESCRDVVIQGCTFDTGDDCIAIKSGRNADGRRVNVPSENIVIRNCRMKEGHGGVVVGSEVSGGVRNVFVEDCVMDSPRLDRALRFKTNSVRGGTIENIFARRITVGQVAEAVVKVDFFYEEGDAGSHTPVMRNLRVEDLTAQKGEFAFWIKGYERSKITGLHFSRCRFEGMAKPNVLEHVADIHFDDVTINGVLSAP